MICGDQFGRHSFLIACKNPFALKKHRVKKLSAVFQFFNVLFSHDCGDGSVANRS